MKTLLLIGMQTDFLPGGAREVPGSATLIPIVNRLLQVFEEVIAANFSLPANHLTFAANHPWRMPRQVIEVEGQATPLQTMYCVSGSFGAEFASGLLTEKISKVFEMGTEADGIPHSAFFDGGNPKSTGLREHLKTNGIAKLFIAGMPLEELVAATALEALGMGIEVVLIHDACLALDESKKEEIFRKITSSGVKFIQSRELS